MPCVIESNEFTHESDVGNHIDLDLRDDHLEGNEMYILLRFSFSDILLKL